VHPWVEVSAGMEIAIFHYMEDYQITTIFTDIGGVLLSNGWDRRMRQSAYERFALDAEETDERHHQCFSVYEEGGMTLDEYLRRVVFCRNRDFTPEQFKEFMFSRSEPKTDMMDLMRVLKERHLLKIVAVCNEGRELTLYRIQKFNLGSFIDFFVCSCFVHARKPESRLYAMAIDCAQSSPGESVYIDDRAEFVAAAAEAGLLGIHHTGYEKTLAALGGMGL
jgi:putative hydrolase of the HAD superfamily